MEWWQIVLIACSVGTGAGILSGWLMLKFILLLNKKYEFLEGNSS